jgi:hypothetical protein
MSQKYGSNGHVIAEPQLIANVFVRSKATYSKSAEMFDVVSVNAKFEYSSFRNC